AHPDDELLGCGGTVALHTRAGDKVTSVIVCEGESLRYGQNGVGQNEHIRRAAEALGVVDVRPLGFPDQRLDTMPLTEIIMPLEAIVKEVQPSIVYCQFGGDINRDHHLLFQAALVVTLPHWETPICRRLRRCAARPRRAPHRPRRDRYQTDRSRSRLLPCPPRRLPRPRVHDVQAAHHESRWGKIWRFWREWSSDHRPE